MRFQSKDVLWESWFEIAWVADVKGNEERAFELGVRDERQAKIDRDNEKEARLTDEELECERREEQKDIRHGATNELQRVITKFLDPRHKIGEGTNNSVELFIYGPRGGLISFKLRDTGTIITPSVLENFENSQCPITVAIYPSSDKSPIRNLILQCKSIWPLYPEIALLVLPSTEDLIYFLGRLSVVIDPEIPLRLEYDKKQTRLKYALVIAAVVLLSIYLI